MLFGRCVIHVDGDGKTERLDPREKPELFCDGFQTRTMTIEQVAEEYQLTDKEIEKLKKYQNNSAADQNV